MNNYISKMNKILAQSNKLYNGLARHYGLGETEFWILYLLRDNDAPINQSDLCNLTFIPKQTINSALKKMENEGIVGMYYLTDSKRKHIMLTDKGIDLAKNTVDKVLMVENLTFMQMTKDNREKLLMLLELYFNLLEPEMNILKEEAENKE